MNKIIELESKKIEYEIEPTKNYSVKDILELLNSRRAWISFRDLNPSFRGVFISANNDSFENIEIAVLKIINENYSLGWEHSE